MEVKVSEFQNEFQTMFRISLNGATIAEEVLPETAAAFKRGWERAFDLGLAALDSNLDHQKTAHYIEFMGKPIFYEMKKGEEIDPYKLVFWLAEMKPDAPISEVARIMKEYKEWKDEHQETT